MVAARILGWLGVFAITVVSVVPGDLRPSTGHGGGLEHAVAYFSTSVLLALGYAERRIAVVLGMATLAATLEALQMWSPGRRPSISDALIGSVSSLVAALAVRLAVPMIRSSGGSRDGR